MKKLALALVCFAAVSFADNVTYTTTGVFSSNGLATISAGGVTITYNPVTVAETVNTPFFNAPLGSFSVSAIPAGSNTFSDSFTLTIDQTVPSVGSQSESTLIDGTVTATNGGFEVSFFPSSFYDGYVYWDVIPEFLGPNQPNQLEAYVLTTPEPGSLALLGGSLFALGLVARRRFAK